MNKRVKSQPLPSGSGSSELVEVVGGKEPLPAHTHMEAEVEAVPVVGLFFFGAKCPIDWFGKDQG